jgi:glycosyltransferase involved in cell wall biosynthesis
MIKLSIIIPVYNEIKTIEKLINKILKLNIKKQVIVVDDGSSDGTQLILKKFKNKIDKLIVHNKNRGKGAAIKSAQKFVKGKYVGIQDADLEYNPKDLEKIVSEMEKKNFDIIYGSRVLNKSMFKNTQNFTHIIRIWGNIFLTKVSNFLNGQNLTDAHTCYKVMDSRIFKKIRLKEKGFSFCPEITTKLSLMNLNIKEFPINYSGRTYEQGKKITAFDGLDALFVLAKYRFFN